MSDIDFKEASKDGLLAMKPYMLVQLSMITRVGIKDKVLANSMASQIFCGLMLIVYL